MPWVLRCSMGACTAVLATRYDYLPIKIIKQAVAE